MQREQKVVWILGVVMALDYSFILGGMATCWWLGMIKENVATPRPIVAGLLYLMVLIPAWLFAMMRWEQRMKDRQSVQAQ